MLSCNGIRDGKSVVKLPYEGIETACVHMCLKKHLAVGNVVGVNLYNADMLTVNGRMEKIQISLVKGEIASRLAVCNKYRLFPCFVYKFRFSS